MTLSYVLAAYNEEKEIQSAIQRVTTALERDFDSYELILVNDASVDRTGEMMLSCAEGNSRIRVLNNYVNLNFGTSVLRGMLAAESEYIIYNAADLPLPPEDTKKVLEAAKNFDVLVLERTEYKGTIWRKITSNLNSQLLKMMFPKLIKGTPVTNYIQVYKRTIVKDIIPLARSPIFVWPEMIFRAKLKGYAVGNMKHRPVVKKIRRGAFGKPHDIMWGIYDIIRFRIRLWTGDI